MLDNPPLDCAMKLFADEVVNHMFTVYGQKAMVHVIHRSPAVQSSFYAKGRTKAGKIITKAKAFDSAHQYFEASDIVHETLYWNAPKKFWEDLSRSIQTVARRWNIEVSHGHDWKWVDSAHVEFADWKGFKARIGNRTPTYDDLVWRCRQLLPTHPDVIRYEADVKKKLAQAAKAALLQSAPPVTQIRVNAGRAQGLWRFLKGLAGR